MLDLINQNHLDKFNGKLKNILTAEIKLGNEVNETAEGWPYKNGIAVFMKRPFVQRYHLFEDIEYTELNDPHYWKEQYFDKLTNNLLACPFQF